MSLRTVLRLMGPIQPSAAFAGYRSQWQTVLASVNKKEERD